MFQPFCVLHDLDVQGALKTSVVYVLDLNAKQTCPLSLTSVLLTRWESGGASVSSRKLLQANDNLVRVQGVRNRMRWNVHVLSDIRVSYYFNCCNCCISTHDPFLWLHVKLLIKFYCYSNGASS